MRSWNKECEIKKKGILDQEIRNMRSRNKEYEIKE